MVLFIDIQLITKKMRCIFFMNRSFFVDVLNLHIKCKIVLKKCKKRHTKKYASTFSLEITLTTGMFYALITCFYALMARLFTFFARNFTFALQNRTTICAMFTYGDAIVTFLNAALA